MHYAAAMLLHQALLLTVVGAAPTNGGLISIFGIRNTPSSPVPRSPQEDTLSLPEAVEAPAPAPAPALTSVEPSTDIKSDDPAKPEADAAAEPEIAVDPPPTDEAAPAKMAASKPMAYTSDLTLSSSCQDIKLDEQTSLVSTCMKDDSTTEESTLDLNNCLGNNNGKLVWVSNGMGNFGFSCGGCVLSDNDQGKALKCACKDLKAKLVSSMVILDDNVSNHDGKIKCFNMAGGCATPPSGAAPAPDAPDAPEAPATPAAPAAPAAPEPPSNGTAAEAPAAEAPAAEAPAAEAPAAEAPAAEAPADGATEAPAEETPSEEGNSEPPAAVPRSEDEEEFFDEDFDDDFLFDDDEA